MAKKTNIKFTDKTHAVNGIISTILGCISLAAFVALVTVSCLLKGNGGLYIGSIGISGMIMSVAGLVFAIKGFGERECYYLFSRIGSTLNIAIILIWVAVYIFGF